MIENASIDDIYTTIETSVDNLLESNDIHSQEISQKIAEYSRLMKDKEISTIEFLDLVDDIIKLEKLNESMDNLELLANLDKMYHTVMSIKSILPFV